jgi:hypothetical protein
VGNHIVKRQTAIISAILYVSTLGAVYAQSALSGPGAGMPYSPNYQPSAPIAPRADTRPPNWVGGPGSDPTTLQSNPTLTPEELGGVWRKNPLPEKFMGTEVIARIGTEVVLAGDVMTNVEDMVQRAVASGQLPESRAKEMRYHLMLQALTPLIDTKLLLIEARREIPKDNMAKIETKVKEIYEKEQLPRLIDGKKIKSRAELIQIMKQAGTSIEDQQRKFLESSLAAQFANKKFGDDKEISHERMLAFYHQHIKEYEIEPRARWEHVMVRFANYPSKADAYAKIAGWGNEIISGVPLADVARKHSDDLSSEEGGQHDWTNQGSLASETIDRAIFSLPVGQLSQIIEDDRGFHILRVLERQEASRKPFGEMQAEIKKKIKAETEGAALKEYVEKLRKEVPIWTIFDDMAEPAKS